MRGEEFRRAVERIGLTPSYCGPLVGLSQRQVMRVLAGHYDAPEAVAKLLRLMEHFKVTADDLEELP